MSPFYWLWLFPRVMSPWFTSSDLAPFGWIVTIGWFTPFGWVVTVGWFAPLGCLRVYTLVMCGLCLCLSITQGQIPSLPDSNSTRANCCICAFSSRLMPYFILQPNICSISLINSVNILFNLKYTEIQWAQLDPWFLVIIGFLQKLHIIVQCLSFGLHLPNECVQQVGPKC